MPTSRKGGMMARQEKQIEVFWDAEICECGGLFDKQHGDHEYATDPIQADFICNNCGAIKRLFEKEFPGVKYRIKDA
jgi:hypothetical protein